MRSGKQRKGTMFLDAKETGLDLGIRSLVQTTQQGSSIASANFSIVAKLFIFNLTNPERHLRQTCLPSATSPRPLRSTTPLDLSARPLNRRHRRRRCSVGSCPRRNRPRRLRPPNPQDRPEENPCNGLQPSSFLLLVLASNQLAMASNLKAMASNLIAMASVWKASTKSLFNVCFWTSKDLRQPKTVFAVPRDDSKERRLRTKKPQRKVQTTQTVQTGNCEEVLHYDTRNHPHCLW